MKYTSLFNAGNFAVLLLSVMLPICLIKPWKSDNVFLDNIFILSSHFLEMKSTCLPLERYDNCNLTTGPANQGGAGVGS